MPLFQPGCWCRGPLGSVIRKQTGSLCADLYLWLTQLSFVWVGQPGAGVVFREICWKKVHSVSPEEGRGTANGLCWVPRTAGTRNLEEEPCHILQEALVMGSAGPQEWQRAPAGVRQDGRQPAWLAPACVTAATVTESE